jgi:hypothetical protein
MKRVLIIYYTQTGQLKQIVDSITSSLEKDCRIFYEEIRPVSPYPFPWHGMPFFQVFPESVSEIPCELEPLKVDPGAAYDLVVLAYQVWYLSPSIPVSSFLQSENTKKLLNGKPVVTILGVRNMWIMAQERIKSRIAGAGGRLVGNIVLTDPAPNLTSVITIVRWMMRGQKGPFRWLGMQFPSAGVPEGAIKEAGQFGEIILKSLASGNFDKLQQELYAAGAVKVDPVLMNIEKRGKMMFGIWARVILKKGGYNDPAREGRLRLFKYYLFLVIYLASPIVSAIFRLIFKFNATTAARIKKKFGSELKSGQNEMGLR